MTDRWARPPTEPSSEALERLTARTQLAEWPAHYPGYRPLGTTCSYVPEEIVHAAGLTPVRIRGRGGAPGHADAHLQSFACALCRSSLNQALSGELGFLAGTVFAHTCDAMQALTDLWRINLPTEHWVDAVMQPANLSRRAARPYLIAELGRFRRRLEILVGRSIGDDNLRASITLYDQTRRLVQSLDNHRHGLSAAQFFAVLDAAQVMPREEFNPLLARAVTKLQQADGLAHEGARLFLTGAVLDEPSLLELIDDLGAQVVGDDLCSGSRHFAGQVGAEGEPMAALADYFLQRPPCPSKLQPGHEAGRHLLEQAERSRADGVVFVLEKFCDPHAFEYALARPTLERAGLPHLLLEMEQTPSLEGLRTRLEAFAEML